MTIVQLAFSTLYHINFFLKFFSYSFCSFDQVKFGVSSTLGKYLFILFHLKRFHTKYTFKNLIRVLLLNFLLLATLTSVTRFSRKIN